MRHLSHAPGGGHIPAIIAPGRLTPRAWDWPGLVELKRAQVARRLEAGRRVLLRGEYHFVDRVTPAPSSLVIGEPVVVRLWAGITPVGVGTVLEFLDLNWPRVGPNPAWVAAETGFADAALARSPS